MHPAPMMPGQQPQQGWQQGGAPPNMYNGGMAGPPPGPQNLSNQMAQMNLGQHPQQQQQLQGGMPPPPQQYGGPMPTKPGMNAPPGQLPPMSASAMPPMGQMPGQRPMPPANNGQQLNGNSNYPQQYQGAQPQQQQQQYPPPSSNTPGPMPPGPSPAQHQQQFPGGPPPPMGQQQQQHPQPPQPAPPQQHTAGPPAGPPMSQQQQPGLPGLPHMPPPLNAQQQQYSNAPPPMNGPPQMGPGGPQQQQQMRPPGMPPMPGQQPMQQPGMPPMPNQQQMQQPGMPPMPNQQQQPGMPPMRGGGPGMQPPQQQQQQQPQYPGQPPMMNQYQQPGGYGQPGVGGYPQQPQAAPAPRLDPEQMPNPIQVIQQNQEAFPGPFVTSQAGLVPPLVTTKFVTQDQGNSGPRFIRSTMYSVPTTAEMMKQVAVPLAVVISPMARTIPGELEPPIVDFGEMGPIRCLRCKAYMSPHMQFIDGGRRFQCLLCKQTTEVPAEYFQHLDHTGQRVDKYQRPELVLGTYEFVATKDYCRNNKPPKPPAIIFVLDVSYNNVKSGFVHMMCQQMREIIRHLPKDQGHQRSYMKVGFITYNNTVHFYNCKSSLAQPQMMIVGDLQEMFMPLLDGFLVDPEESAAVIDALMEQIPAMFADSRETETILLPALQAGLEALKASETVGKLLVFHSSLPIAEAPGKLKNREDRKLLGTEKEKTILMPQCTSYNNLGQDCVQAGCSVDLFLLNNSYIDIATIGQISRMTGGEIYKYTYFQADIDGKRLVADVIKNVSRPIAFDTVMRVRTSTGIRPTDFYGHFFMSNTTDLEIASVDCDKSVAIELKHDDKLTEDVIHIQVALLYTSCSGQRRLRVMNLALTTCTLVADLFRGCDLQALVLFFAKQSVFKLMDSAPKILKDQMIQRVAQILASYRKHCAAPASPGQLILPESLKLLPLYTACLMKCDAVGGGSDMACDDRSFNIHFVMTMDLPAAVSYFYPSLIPVHTANVEETDLPQPIRCTAEKLAEEGAYILENGVYMFLWLGMNLSPEFTQNVFGVYRVHEVDTERMALPVLDNPLSKRIRGIVDQIQDTRSRCMRLMLVKQRDKLENVMRNFLVEDRGMNGSTGYVDFLCHIHKEVRNVSS